MNKKYKRTDMSFKNPSTSVFYAITLLFACSIFFVACDDDNDNDEQIEVNFKLEYDGAPLVMSAQDYNYPDGSPLIISNAVYYISNFSLIDGSDDPRTDKKSAVYALDFNATNNSVEDAQKGITINIQDLGLNRSYSGIAFDLGIEPERNAMLPASFDNDNPLASATYWAGWSSYIFSKTEGKLDIDGDGQYELNMSLHLGSDEAVRRKTLDVDFDQNSGAINIVIDLKKFFGDDGNIYDITTNPNTHNLVNMPEVMELSDNLLNCFSIE